LKVLGLCGMCKTRIEKAAYSVRGVSKAEWNQEKQSLKLTYRANRTNQETIERAIAKAGHDTENFITDEKTWENLHHCCKYPRNPEWLKKNKRYDEE
jgi:copper chaperone CopZ